MPGEFKGIIWAHTEKEARSSAKEIFGMGSEAPIVDKYGPAPSAYAVWGSGLYVPQPPTPPTGGEGGEAGGAPPATLSFTAGEYEEPPPSGGISLPLQQAIEGVTPATIQVILS